MPRPAPRPPSHRAPPRARTAPFLLAAVAVGLALVAAACGSGGPTAAKAVSARPMTLGAGSLPGQTSATLPAFPAFYDAHRDLVVVTDAYPKAAATVFQANYAPSLQAVRPASQPNWYIVRGAAAPGQTTVLGSEPGEHDYSPLWRTVIVRWKPGVPPKLLTSDNMILGLAQRGELTATVTSLVVNATVVAIQGRST